MLGRASLTTDASRSMEWLVTNGLGGFASGTVALANTRRYHGLLVAARRPPVDRVLLLAGLAIGVVYRGRRYELHTAEYADGTVAPRGCELLESFRLEQGLPVWTWRLADALLELRIVMPAGVNATHLRFALVDGMSPLELELRPLASCRDYHAHWRGGGSPRVSAGPGSCRVTMYEGATPVTMAIDHGCFEPAADWHWNFLHRLEAERGLDALEDLFVPGVFRAVLARGTSVALTASDGAAVVPDADATLAAGRARATRLVERAGVEGDPVAESLVLAADAFLVARGPADAPAGRSVIAGYPWFADWGRDAMIALPGLALATGRADVARAVLLTFAAHVSDGMLPNRFPDGGEAPEYNTVDGTLWYFQAIREYLSATDDRRLVDDLYPVLRDIVAWHRRGTRHGIRVDAADGLLRAGEPGVQLTWMDARVDGHEITPRIGKPVEVNALWLAALSTLGRLAERVGDRRAARDYLRMAGAARAAFAPAFWNEARGYLNDVVDGPEGELRGDGCRVDASLRPNQVFAISLGEELLNARQARLVVDACARELVTPVGLRSLAPSHPDYRGRCTGGPAERDAAYHQGTVWSWLAGPYALAYASTTGDVAGAQRLLAGMVPHLAEGCLGTVGEIFDGDTPHAPRGCFAQAWGVAELLRAWRALATSAAATAHVAAIAAH